MKILALELSSGHGSVAFLAGKLVFSREWTNDRKNSGPFFEHLADVHQKFGKPDTIIVGLGPGSYAGTRIAISAAIGLSFGVGAQNLGHDSACPSIKLLGFPSICAIESNTAEYFVIGDARRQTFFFARVRERDLIEGPDLMAEAELREKLDKIDKDMPIFTTEKLPQFERAMLSYPSAKLLGRLATDSKRQFTQPPLEPMYLREPHITIPKQ